MSDHELFSENEESCDDWPMTYEQFVTSSKRSRFPDRRVVLQTSCSSDDEESPPRSRAKRMGNQPKEPTAIIEAPKNRSSLTTAGYGAGNRESSQSSSKTASNAPNQRSTLYARSSVKTTTPRGHKRPTLTHVTLTDSTNARSAAEKENGCTNSQNKSLSSIEVALLETNQLLRHVIKRVDNCEKQIKSFEKKFDESTTSCSSTSAGSTPSRKKEVPEEVRVCCAYKSSCYHLYIHVHVYAFFSVKFAVCITC